MQYDWRRSVRGPPIIGLQAAGRLAEQQLRSARAACCSLAVLRGATLPTTTGHTQGRTGTDILTNYYDDCSRFLLHQAAGGNSSSSSSSSSTHSSYVHFRWQQSTYTQPRPAYVVERPRSVCCLCRSREGSSVGSRRGVRGLGFHFLWLFGWSHFQQLLFSHIALAPRAPLLTIAVAEAEDTD